MGVRGFKMFYQRGKIFFSTCFVCMKGWGGGGLKLSSSPSVKK